MVAAGVAGALVGLVIGLAIGGGDEDTDPLKGMRDARSSLQRAADVLDIVTVEYAQGVEDGRVASAPEYQGARDALARSRELYLDGRPVLQYVDAQAATRLDHAYQRLAGAATRRAPEQDIEAQARALARALDGALAPGR
jgi:uncharacterized protein (DUF885 family)